ncbi:EmrB/QacA subfamily drug resistance transporter [Streptococcus gallinaceus]|uniref:MFS transporter n=1 Tax=Streptococcus gallinaceus TaxID=165758 RepID=UPI00209DFAFE|nr:MFS transporter [Streptococcus gallinaceus]MCP1638910.1 EmrB/QacA subfamily drug resistance transporter [Streptococcus gallinaceus]MCP1769846.1 EmrB/QacA subfamily drug resistance transporter [Streptococcus gallinaceus]
MTAKKWHVVPAMIATAILSFCGILFETSMNVTFPTLMKEFGVGATVIQWATTGNLLAVAATVPLSAYLIRNFSERQIFIMANSLFLMGVVVDSFAFNLSLLLIGRVLQGIGTGLALPLMYHIILHYVPVERRGFMMGIAAMTTLLAPAIGPTYGGFVLAHFGWQMIFVLLFPVLIGSSIVGLLSIPSAKVEITEKLNLPAFISLGIGLVFLLLSIEKLSLIFLAAALLGLVIFYYFNRKNRLLNLGVFGNHVFVVLLYGVFAYQIVPLALSFVLPNHLQLVLGQNSTQAGMFMFPGAIIVVAMSPVSGYLFDKVGSFKPILAGLVTVLVGLSAMFLFIMGNSVWLLLLADIIVKLGMGIGASNMVTSALTKLSKEESADGNSVLNTFQQFAGAFATAVASQLFSLGEATGLSNGASLGGRNAVVFVMITVILAMLGLIFLRQKKELR